MSNEQKIGWLANLPRLDAQAQIKAGNIGDDPDTIRDLYLRAYDDSRLADRAYARAVEMRMEYERK